MAFLKRKRVRGNIYYYIVRSVRCGDTVHEKVLEYLGRDPEPARLRRALRYWGVKRKSAHLHTRTS
ncbi:MAG: hypothetical protein L0191_19200 [Acidobacteria bacterium]|nr:hypothetical protein [Acidobacteriota bacterium]